MFPLHLHYFVLHSSSLSDLCFTVQRSVLPDCVSQFVVDADFTYQDFSPRGVQAPPTMRAQVQYYICIFLTHSFKDLLFC